MTTENDDTFDARVAERFADLDRLEPPEITPSSIAGPRLADHAGPGRRSTGRLVLAAVAASVGILGASVGLLALRGPDDSETVATDDGLEDGTEGTTERSPNREPRADEGPSDGLGDGDENDVIEVETSPSSSTASSTTSLDRSTSSPSTTSAVTTTESGSASTVTTTVTTATTEPDGSALQVIQGTVTAVFTDCQQHLVLTEDGEIDDSGPVSCDGGSWVIIDGTRIGTASGYVSGPEYVYNHHIGDLLPGEQATAVAATNSYGALNLNCEACSLRRGLHADETD